MRVANLVGVVVAAVVSSAATMGAANTVTHAAPPHEQLIYAAVASQAMAREAATDGPFRLGAKGASPIDAAGAGQAARQHTQVALQHFARALTSLGAASLLARMDVFAAGVLHDPSPDTPLLVRMARHLRHATTPLWVPLRSMLTRRPPISLDECRALEGEVAACSLVFSLMGRHFDIYRDEVLGTAANRRAYGDAARDATAVALRSVMSLSARALWDSVTDGDTAIWPREEHIAALAAECRNAGATATGPANVHLADLLEAAAPELRAMAARGIDAVMALAIVSELLGPLLSAADVVLRGEQLAIAAATRIFESVNSDITEYPHYAKGIEPRRAALLARAKAAQADLITPQKIVSAIVGFGAAGLVGLVGLAVCIPICCTGFVFCCLCGPCLGCACGACWLWANVMWNLMLLAIVTVTLPLHLVALLASALGGPDARPYTVRLLPFASCCCPSDRRAAARAKQEAGQAQERARQEAADAEQVMATLRKRQEAKKNN